MRKVEPLVEKPMPRSRVWQASKELNEPKVCPLSRAVPEERKLISPLKLQVHEIISMGKHENDKQAKALLTEVARQVSFVFLDWTLHHDKCTLLSMSP